MSAGLAARNKLKNPFPALSLVKAAGMKSGDYDPISLNPEPCYRSVLVLDTLFL
jgi:hypothetical protein